MSQFLNFGGNQGTTFKNHGTGGGTSFTLDLQATTNSVLLAVGGVLQEPGVDYTVSGTTITTTSSVTAGIEVFSWIIHKPGTAPTIQDNSVTGGKIALTSQAEGDLMYCNASGDWVRLPKGTAGQFLKQNSGLTAPEWGAGDGGGAWAFIETLTASASSSLDFESLNSSSYTSYMCIFEGLVPATANQSLRIRGGTGSPTVTYITSSTYDFGMGYVGDDGGGNITSGNSNQTSGVMSGLGYSNQSDDGASGTIIVYDPHNTSTNTLVSVDTVVVQDSTDDFHREFGGMRVHTTTEVTGIQIFMSSGTITSGDFHWYGLTQ